MKNETADEFKVGDTVWCAMYGEGVVTSISKDGEIGVYYRENDNSNYYTQDGIAHGAVNRTLFFSEPKVEGSVKRPFVSKLVGKRVVINTTEDLCLIGVVNSETSTTLVIDGRHYFKGGIDTIYEITSDNLLES